MNELETIINCFSSFCNENKIDLEKIIKQNNQLLKYYKNLYFDEEIYNKTKDYLTKTHDVTTILFDELKNIVNILNNAGVRLILLKGLILGDELFGDYHIRNSGDIDLYIHPDDIRLACRLLGDDGYMLLLAGIKVTESSIDNDPFLAYGNHHMEPMEKKKPDGTYICIEIHRCPYHKVRFDYGESDYSSINSEDLFERAEIHNINGIDILKLEANDYLINLLQHFTTHFLNDFRRYIWYKEETFGIDFGLLHELIHFMMVKEDLINFEEIYNRAYKWGIIDDIKFALYCVDRVFGDIIKIPPKHGFDSVVLDNADFARRMLKDFISLDINKLIFGDIDQEFLYILKRNSKHENKLKVPYFPQRISIEHNIINYLRNHDFQPYSCTLEISWDNEYLYMHIHNLNFSRILNTKERKGFNEQEGFCILFYFQEPNIHFIDSIYVNVENDTEQVLDYQKSSCFGKKIYIPELCVAKTIRDKNNDQLDIKLNWNFLHTTPRKGLKIGFRIFEANAFATYEFMTIDRNDIIELF